MPHMGEFTKKTHASLTAQADLHTPKLHASRHQNGGADEISVAGLSGELADSQPPKAHASAHHDGGADPINASLLDKMLKIVPYNAKIADISEADTNKHTLDLATALSETRKIIAVILAANRISGTAGFATYPNEGTQAVVYRPGFSDTYTYILKDGTQRLQYAMEAANDDFDLWCFGYIVEA